MHKQLTPIAALSLALVPALTVFDAAAGLVVDDPVDYTTAKVDPTGAQDIDGTVGPNLNLGMWNAQTPLFTVDFDQAGSFTSGSQLDTVNLTVPGKSITFSSNAYTSGQGFKVDNTAIRCTSGTQSVTTMASLTPGVDWNPDVIACDILTIRFSTPVTGVAFTAMYEGGGLQAAYYDAGHNRLYYANQNSAGGDTTTDGTWKDFFFTYQNNVMGGGNIASIEIKRLYVSDSFSIDDLSFTVPEPASLGLLGLGALVLGRRRQG